MLSSEGENLRTISSHFLTASSIRCNLVNRGVSEMGVDPPGTEDIGSILAESLDEAVVGLLS